MKNKKKIFIPIALVVVILLITSIVFMVLHKNSKNPEQAVKDFYSSLLPDYNAEKLEQCVGSAVYQIRFDDDGYFIDRYERTRKQIVYYYGENFQSKLSNFSVSDVSDTDKSSISREYKSKYSLDIEEIKRVTFSVTLSSEYEEKSRTQSLIVLKYGGDWLIYDYDAYWFAYM